MLSERQQKILKIIVENYIKNAKPIASGFLAAKMRDDVSSATIRNELLTLESDGFLAQPHTSAGRVPTEKAYKFFIETFLNKEKKDETLKVVLRKKDDDRERLKTAAKRIADEVGAVVFVAFDEGDLYYTGFSDLFGQPEFFEQQVVVDISLLVDDFDKVLAELYGNVGVEPEVLVGGAAGFSDKCGAVVVDAAGTLVGVLGPMRMDYQKAYSLLKFLASNL
jgi:heat-inducible transcriptional repressor